MQNNRIGPQGPQGQPGPGSQCQNKIFKWANEILGRIKSNPVRSLLLFLNPSSGISNIAQKTYEEKLDNTIEALLDAQQNNPPDCAQQNNPPAS